MASSHIKAITMIGAVDPAAIERALTQIAGRVRASGAEGEKPIVKPGHEHLIAADRQAKQLILA
jgi:hypothetical protein